MVGLQDPVLALDFDLAATARLLAVDRTAASAGLQPGTDAAEDDSSNGSSHRVREEHW
jgi:hypothetical protein